MDDDKSGTDFSRFDDIRNRAKNKEIDVIVFKNSARLGRNQRESLEFVEKDCPYNHRCTSSVRFDDSYDESNCKCSICGSKLIKRHDDKSFFRLAEKHGIEIGDNRPACNFLHINN